MNFKMVIFVMFVMLIRVIGLYMNVRLFFIVIKIVSRGKSIMIMGCLLLFILWDIMDWSVVLKVVRMVVR